MSNQLSAGIGGIMQHSIKCGRRIFVLRRGDWIMDNGACLQLASREVYAGDWNYSSPIVPKKEFKRFVALPCVQKIVRKGYTAYVYLPEKEKSGDSVCAH